MLLVAHLHFCQRTSQTKKSKRATKPTHHDTTNKQPKKALGHNMGSTPLS